MSSDPTGDGTLPLEAMHHSWHAPNTGALATVQGNTTLPQNVIVNASSVRLFSRAIRRIPHR